MSTYTYTHTLTAIEEACGVTMPDVARVITQGLFSGSDHSAFILPKDTAPALASSAARCAFAGQDVEFSHLSNGYPVYRLAR